MVSFLLCNCFLLVSGSCGVYPVACRGFMIEVDLMIPGSKFQRKVTNLWWGYFLPSVSVILIVSEKM